MNYNRLKIAYQKAIKTFKKYHRHNPSTLPEKLGDEDDINRRMGIYRKTKVFCSGPCCGNPRRHKGTIEHQLTIQERKANNINEEWE